MPSFEWVKLKAVLFAMKALSVQVIATHIDEAPKRPKQLSMSATSYAKPLIMNLHKPYSDDPLREVWAKTGRSERPQ